MIKKFKFIKFGFISFGISILVGVSSLSLISCGHKVNSWEKFKANALNVSPNDLKSEISNLSNYYWTKDYNAVFSKTGKPAVSEDNHHTIMATIIIQYHITQYEYPINFYIKYDNQAYHLKNWRANKSPWAVFKEEALIAIPRDLLYDARHLNYWLDFRWTGNATEAVWQDSDQAEFDIHGGIGNSDPYAGMGGKPIANDEKHTITAIISVAGKNGLYDSKPFKSVITDDANQKYNIQNWKFSKLNQLQSHDKYLDALKPDIALAKSVKWTINNLWEKFATTNYLSTNHIANNNVLKWAMAQYSGFSEPVYVWEGGHNTLPLPDGSGLQTTITIGFVDINNNSITHNLVLTNDFIFTSSHKNSGIAFSYNWNAKIID